MAKSEPELEDPSHPTSWLTLLNVKEQQIRHTPTREAIQEIIRLSVDARASIALMHYSHHDLALLYLKIVELLILYVA